MPTGIEHIEPFQVLDAFTGLGQGIVDGVFDAGGGRTYQFDFLVGVVVAHAVLLSPGGCPESLAVIFPTARINRSESRCSFLHFHSVLKSQSAHATQLRENADMASNALRKASLQSMEAEIESLLKSLESLKDDASDESRKTLKALKSNAENALKHSRHLLSDAYEEVKVRTRETGIATRDYAQEHPWTTAGVAVGALGLLAAYLLCKRGD